MDERERDVLDSEIQGFLQACGDHVRKVKRMFDSFNDEGMYCIEVGEHMGVSPSVPPILGGWYVSLASYSISNYSGKPKLKSSIHQSNDAPPLVLFVQACILSVTVLLGQLYIHRKMICESLGDHFKSKS
jgi:hypothetical protein